MPRHWQLHQWIFSRRMKNVLKWGLEKTSRKNSLSPDRMVFRQHFRHSPSFDNDGSFYRNEDPFRNQNIEEICPRAPNQLPANRNTNTCLIILSRDLTTQYIEKLI